MMKNKQSLRGVDWRSRGQRKNENAARRPCLIIGIRGDLLDQADPITAKLARKPNASFVSEKEGGVGEYEGVIYDW